MTIKYIILVRKPEGTELWVNISLLGGIILKQTVKKRCVRVLTDINGSSRTLF
jgi:hypothetical protein